MADYLKGKTLGGIGYSEPNLTGSFYQRNRPRMLICLGLYAYGILNHYDLLLNQLSFEELVNEYFLVKNSRFQAVGDDPPPRHFPLNSEEQKGNILNRLEEKILEILPK